MTSRAAFSEVGNRAVHFSSICEQLRSITSITAFTLSFLPKRIQIRNQSLTYINFTFHTIQRLLLILQTVYNQNRSSASMSSFKHAFSELDRMHSPKSDLLNVIFLHWYAINVSHFKLQPSVFRAVIFPRASRSFGKRNIVRPFSITDTFSNVEY